MIEFKPVRLEDKQIIERHTVPEYGRIVADLGQDWRSGVEYRQPPFTDWLIEAGRPDDLGLYLKAATQTIPKKNMLAFWDTFGEIFGMPTSARPGSGSSACRCSRRR